MEPTKFTLEAFAQAEHWVWEAFKVYQTASDNYEVKKDLAKDILASIMSDLDRPMEKVSEAKLERMARATDKWQKYKDELKALLIAFGEAKVKYLSTVKHWDTIQSGLAYKRVEMKKLGWSDE